MFKATAVRRDVPAELRWRDYHVHTAYCGHASGEMEQYVQQALAEGLTELCFCDHMPLQDGFDPEHRMSAEHLSPYINEINRLRDQYPGLTIHLGFEADYIAGMERYLRSFKKRYKVDYYLMSIHFIAAWPEGEWAFAFPYGSGTIASRYGDYFKSMLAGVNSGIFDAVAHFDLIKRSDYPVMDVVPDLVEETLESIARSGMAMEFNTSGLRKPIAEMFPTTEIVTRAAGKGIPICLGSDAHHPEQVGFSFEMAAASLGEIKNLVPFRIKPRQ